MISSLTDQSEFGNCFSIIQYANESMHHPGRGGQTEQTSDQTIFERTHVLGALELHGLEKYSSALLYGQWSGSRLIRGHFGRGRSDQRSLHRHFIINQFG